MKITSIRLVGWTRCGAAALFLAAALLESGAGRASGQGNTPRKHKCADPITTLQDAEDVAATKLAESLKAVSPTNRFLFFDPSKGLVASSGNLRSFELFRVQLAGCEAEWTAAKAEIERINSSTPPTVYTSVRSLIDIPGIPPVSEVASPPDDPGQQIYGESGTVSDAIDYLTARTDDTDSRHAVDRIANVLGTPVDRLHSLMSEASGAGNCFDRLFSLEAEVKRYFDDGQVNLGASQCAIKELLSNADNRISKFRSMYPASTPTFATLSTLKADIDTATDAANGRCSLAAANQIALDLNRVVVPYADANGLGGYIVKWKGAVQSLFDGIEIVKYRMSRPRTDVGLLGSNAFIDPNLKSILLGYLRYRLLSDPNARLLHVQLTVDPQSSDSGARIDYVVYDTSGNIVPDSSGTIRAAKVPAKSKSQIDTWAVTQVWPKPPTDANVTACKHNTIPCSEWWMWCNPAGQN